MFRLVDTSVWIDHFRNDNKMLTALLEQNRVLIHPFIVGELACGQLKNRKQILFFLNQLPVVEIASDQEVFHLIESKKLYGKGLGWVDCHLLASSKISRAKIFTLDKKLDLEANS